MAFPVVESVTITANLTNAGNDGYEVNLPATIKADDLLIVILSVYRFGLVASDGSVPSGWTKIAYREDSILSWLVAYKQASGSEGATLNVAVRDSTTRRAAAQVYRITGWNSVEFPTFVMGVTSTPNPPNVTASWGVADNLFLALGGAADDDESWTSAPSNYTNLTSTLSGGGTNNSACTGSARRELAAASDNPGTFTLSGVERWAVTTCVIEPGSKGGSAGTTITASGAGVLHQIGNQYMAVAASRLNGVLQ